MYYKNGEYKTNPNNPGVANAHDTHYRAAGWIPVEDHRPESVEPYERLVLDNEYTEDGKRHREWVAERMPDSEIRDILTGKLDDIDTEYNSDRSWREYVIANEADFHTEAVERMREAEDKAQIIRNEIEGLNNDQ